MFTFINCYRYIADSIDIDHRTQSSNSSRPPSVLRASWDRNEVSVVLRRLSESADQRQSTTVFVQASLSGTLLPSSPFSVPCICVSVCGPNCAIFVSNKKVYIVCILCECRSYSAATIPGQCVYINTSNIYTFILYFRAIKKLHVPHQ